MSRLDTSDADLLLACAGGRADALSTLYDRHGILAFTIAYRMLGDRESAEDAVQESFLSLWLYAGRYQLGRSAVRSWLLRIVRQRCIDQFRHRQILPPIAPDADVLAHPAETDVAHEALQNVEVETVRQALAALPPAQRQSIEMAYFDGLTQSEIAEHLGVPLGTVKGRIRLGLKHLSRLLAVPAMEKCFQQAGPRLRSE